MREGSTSERLPVRTAHKNSWILKTAARFQASAGGPKVCGLILLYYFLRNQLVSISGAITASFQYDAFGRRINKTVGGTSTSFLYPQTRRAVTVGPLKAICKERLR
jgi:hypothetical protein